MRSLTSVDPKTMTFGELIRASAEAAAQTLFWLEKGAEHMSRQWKERQAEIERAISERFG